MKITKFILLPIAAVLSLSANATPHKFVPTNNDLTTELCVAAASNNLSRYKFIAKHSRLKRSYIADQVSCNNQNIVEFAIHHNALKVAAYINKYKKHQVTITDLASASDKQRM